MDTPFEPSAKRIKQDVPASSDRWGMVVYEESECDPEKYPMIEKKVFEQVWDTGCGLDPYNDATYFYAVYDAIGKLDKAIESLAEVQRQIAMYDVSDYRWGEAYNKLTEMRNDWVEIYKIIKKRAIRVKREETMAQVKKAVASALLNPTRMTKPQIEEKSKLFTENKDKHALSKLFTRLAIFHPLNEPMSVLHIAAQIPPCDYAIGEKETQTVGDFQVSLVHTLDNKRYAIENPLSNTECGFEKIASDAVPEKITSYTFPSLHKWGHPVSFVPDVYDITDNLHDDFPIKKGMCKMTLHGEGSIVECVFGMFHLGETTLFW